VYEDDYILRAVRRLTQALASLLGAVAAGKHEDAEEALEEGYQVALGPHRGMLDLLDGATLARLIEDRPRVAGLADLCEAEASLRTQQGHTQLAALRAKQAASLRAALAGGDEV
jgi:hypothetical protein